MLNSLENGRCSFIFTTLYLPPLQSPPKIISSISVNFPLPTSPLFVHKIILAIQTNTPFYYSTTVFSPSFFLQTTIPKIYTQNIFPTSDIYPIQAEATDQGARESCEDWHCFNLSFVPQSMENDSRAHNRWLLIAQAQKIDVLVFDEDASNRNVKLFNPPSLIPSIHCHYFHTLLTPSQELRFQRKPIT